MFSGTEVDLSHFSFEPDGLKLHVNKMPLHKVIDSSVLDAKIPSHLHCVSITTLTVTSDPSDGFVKARLVHKGPLLSCAQKNDTEMLKAQIREEDPPQTSTEHTSINVILFSRLAQDFSQSVKPGDVVILAGFTIKTSPTFLVDKLHPCHLEMEGQDANIFVCPTSRLSSSSSSSPPAANPSHGPPVANTTLGPPATNATIGPSAAITTLGPPATNTTIGPSAAITTLGPPATNTTIGAPAAITTLGPPVANPTLVPSATNTTIGAPAAITTLGPPVANTTLGPPATNTTIGPPAAITTLGPPAAITTLGPPAAITTLDPPATNTTINAPAAITTLGPPVVKPTLVSPAAYTTLGPPVTNTTLGPPATNTTLGPPAVGFEAKYVYTSLNMLKDKATVNVYGVVTFFKLPYPTKGSDYCSMIKITDQSNVKVSCSIFSNNLDQHPVILQVGDIIRLHRFKANMFNNAMTLINTRGWSAVTFDGIINSPVLPRPTARTFNFEDSDKRTVQELRQWAATQQLLSSNSSHSLSAVKPLMYFDLTCQLLAKAVMDSRCILLKVWDGTKCENPLLNVSVPFDAIEGESTVAKDRMNLVANVLVYDNHVGVAQSLKPGMFLRIYNLHAMPQRAPNQTSDQSEQLAFHLHGGTVYGRGLRSIPEDSPELRSLKSMLENHVDLECNDEVNDETLLEIWYTPPESVVMRNEEERDLEPPFTVRTCQHTLNRVTLAQVKSSTPPLMCHIRAQVKTYEPKHLYQCLKLFCSKCKSMKEIPDENAIANLLLDSARDDQPCREAWATTSSANFKADRNIAMHISSDMVAENTYSQLNFVQGMTLNEICILSQHYKNLVPVRSDNGRMNLIDLTAPFLFCGSKRYYGCKRCSLNTLESPVFTGVENWDEHAVAEVLGVQLMQYRLVMQFELQDQTDTLDALLWENAERFFQVSAVDVSVNQDMQNKIQTIMSKLRPEEGSIEEHPWVDICLAVYTANDNEGNQVCYQITDTEVRLSLDNTCSISVDNKK